MKIKFKAKNKITNEEGIIQEMLIGVSVRVELGYSSSSCIQCHCGCYSPFWKWSDVEIYMYSDNNYHKCELVEIGD